MAVKNPKKTIRTNVGKGKAYIKSTFNNTIVSIADANGNVLCWGSTGQSGFKGTRKSTPYAAQVVARTVATKAKDFGVTELEIFVKGVGSGRESAVRTVGNGGFLVTKIVDVTPIPHNGPRAKKVRKV